MVELMTFKVGLASPANTFFAIWMAKAGGFYERNGLAVAGERETPDLEGVSGFLGLRLGQAHRGDLRVAIGAARNLRLVHRAVVFRQAVFAAERHRIEAANDLTGPPAVAINMEL